jgi:hypothetical protein
MASDFARSPSTGSPSRSPGRIAGRILPGRFSHVGLTSSGTLAGSRAELVLRRFGAIAEFHRDPDEPAAIAEQPVLSVATSRGAIRLSTPDELRPVAYETISKCIDSWGHGLALCLPRERARMNGRGVITELGPDREAVRADDRDALLFDLGLGGGSAAICVRTSDA